MPSEIIIIDHSITTDEARGDKGDILFRFGNAQTYRGGSRFDQILFNQHSVNFLRDLPGEGHILLFNNGRQPDRWWSDVLELKLPETFQDSGVSCLL